MSYVCTATAVSRALGDRDLKVNCGTKAPLVCASPELRHLALDTRKDKIMILACDGVWDVITEQVTGHLWSIHIYPPLQEAVSLVESCVLKGESDFCTAGASSLVKLAFQKGSQV